MPWTEFVPAHEITLVRGTPHPRSPAHEAAVADGWRETRGLNPSLFNGPLASPLEASVSGGVCTVSWYHSDFAHYSFSRQHPGLPATQTVGTLFVSVAVPTTDGRLLVGRMAGHTAAPGVVQLPGGGVSIGPEQPEIAAHDLAATAVEEASEELGLLLDPAELQVRGVITRHSPPDVGVVFATGPRPWEVIHAAFTAMRQSEEAAGTRPELDELLAIGSGADLANQASGRGTVIDYLPLVVGAILNSRDTE